MKKDLLVTLADENYIKPAKQLFSSVYHNGGWEGDYMLLGYKIPDKGLKWFADKGILVKQCDPVPYTENLNTKRAPIVFNKIYLFSTEFRKWKNVVFLDADIIVRSSLEKLTHIKGFAAPNATGLEFKKQFLETEQNAYEKLTRNYRLIGKAFNTGIFAFSTDIIEEDSFLKFTDLIKLYGNLCIYGEEPILNLFFYKKWTELPLIYNLYPHHVQSRCNLKPHQIKSIIFHFVAANKLWYKPWDKRSPFYKEWHENFLKAELINLKTRPRARTRWTKLEIYRYILYIKLRTAIYYMCPKAIGVLGIFLKKHNPNLYFKLKKILNNK